MAIPQQLIDATPAFVQWCEDRKPKLREIKNTRGRHFQGSVNRMDESEYRKVVEVPDGKGGFRKEWQAAETFRDFLGGRPAHSFLPGSLRDLRVNRYEAPDGEGWFITAEVGMGGKTYRFSYDGDGPEGFGHDWREVV